MSEKKGVFQKLASLGREVKSQWNEPKEGNYVPYKEIAVFSGAGIGVKTVNCMVAQLSMSATCLLVGSIYKLSPTNLLILFIISNVISVLKTPIVSWLVDNTNTKMGKFRPYLLWAGIPCVIGVVGITWLVPVDGTSLTKMILIGIFYNILYIGQHVYTNAYMGISQVISPNSKERTAIMSVSEFISNLGPSLVNLILPIFAQIFFGDEGMLNIMAYRILLPAFTIVGFLLGLIVMLKTQERVIKPKTEKQKVNMMDGLKQFASNREFWIVSVGKFFDGFRGALSILMGWICLYQLRNSAMMGILPSITSTAFIPGMLLAPLLIQKLGFKKFGFASFMMNALAALVMLLTFKQSVVFFVIALFLFNFASGPQYIIQTSLTADALDHQQLKTNERVEGFVQNMQLVFSVVGGIVATSILTYIYESHGLVAGIDGTTDYSVLADAAVRNPIITDCIIVALVASVLSALPFLLSKMTKAKHDEIIEQLKERADKEMASSN